MAHQITSDDISKQNDELYRSLFDNMLNGFAYCQMLYEDGKPQDFIYLAVNAAFVSQTGLTDVTGKRATEVIPGIRESDPVLFEIYGRVAMNGRPEKFEMFVEALQMWFLISVYCPATERFVAVFDVITEQKRAVDSLRASEQRHRMLSEIMLHGLVYQDANGEIISMNPAAEWILGMSRDEYIGRSSVDVENLTVRENGKPFPGMEHPAMVALTTGLPVSAVVMGVYNPRLSEYRWISIGAVPVFRPGESSPYEVFALFEDITARKQAEKALLHSQNMLARTESITNVGSWEWVVATDTVTWSEEMFRIHKLNPADGAPTFAEHARLYHPEDMSKLEQAVSMALSEGKSYELELRAIRQDGEIRFCLARGFPERDSEGSVVRLFGLLQEITEKKKAEEALLKSEQRYRMLFQNQPSGYALHEIILDAEGKPCDYRFLEINSYFEKLTGLNATDLIGKTQLEVMPNSEQFWAETYGQVALTGKAITFENFSGDLNKYYHVTAYSPEPGKFATVFLDITEIKQADEKIREKEEYLRFFFEYAPASLAMFDRNMCYLHVSQRWMSDYGLGNRTIVGLSHYEVFPEIPEKWKEAHQRGLSGEVLRKGEDKFVRNDGSVQWVSWEIRPWFKRDGTIGGIVIFSEDITSRKKDEAEKLIFEQQLQQTQKLESLGVLSGGIAHDFNNILAIIIGNCTLAKMDYEAAENNILEIEKAAERAAGLCRQMLAYAGKAQLTPTQVNMSLLVDDMVNMLKSSLPQNAVIKPSLPTNIPLINADDSQLRQIVMNLIINASEAIDKEKGDIEVLLTEVTMNEGLSEMDYNGKPIRPGEYVCLEVSDNGCGMDEETKWRIFEPFYTTKFTGRGLGMSAVLGIINSHGGALQFFSQLGQGTTFTVYLPVLKKQPAGEETLKQSLPSTPWQGSGTILLAEDEESVRLVTKAFLNKFGFTVLEAVNGKEALELYQRNAADITLVMTDMGMPIMDGYGLFHELKKLNPELPIIVSSGYGEAVVSSRLSLDKSAGLISKPYGPDQLREVLRKALVC